jgi:O-antigen/teichoic acid export membrane protein
MSQGIQQPVVSPGARVTESRSTKVLILSSGQALTALVGIASAAVLARVFSQHDYGTYRQTLLAYTFAAPFVTLGFDRALYYFLPGEEKRSRGILVENLLWLFGAGAILSLFLLAGGNRLLAMRFNNPDLKNLLLVLIPYPLLMLPAASLPACLMARNRTGQVAGFNVGSRLLMFIAIILPCLVWPYPSTAIAGVVVGAAVTTVAAVVLMIRSTGGSWQPTYAGIRRQAVFSVPLGLASLLGTVSQSLDQVLVAAFCSTAAFAVYVNGAMEIPLIGMVTGSVTSVLIVDYARFYKEGRIQDIIDLVHRAMVKCALILIPVMGFLLCIAPELMRVLYGKSYEGSATFFRVYLLLLPVRILSFGAILTATGNSQYILIQTGLALVTQLITCWYGIHWFGAIGAASASVVTMYLVTIPYLVTVLKRILRCSVPRLFPWHDLAKVGLASFVPGVVVLLLRRLIHAPDIFMLPFAGTTYAGLAALLFSWFGYLNPPLLYARSMALVRRFHE